MKKILPILFLFLLSLQLSAQTVQLPPEKIEISETHAILLGKSIEVRNIIPSNSDFKAKKGDFKKDRAVPENFIGRRGYSKAIIPELEHLGADPLLVLPKAGTHKSVSTKVNQNGLGNFGSPHDPTGDIGTNYYIQAINVTIVGVYDKAGTLIQQFNMSDLWASLGANSVGDPIVVFDEQSDRWFITEFTDPANLLVAVSETNDPLGSYFAYSFSTPNFPDYPKYGIWGDALVVTTNEQGAGNLHQYFIEKAGLLAGNASVPIQRIQINGNNNTQAGFYVTTPIDTDGDLLPSDMRPMVVKLNDASWGQVGQDAIELIRFDIDWNNSNNTTSEVVTIPVTNFDGYPCSATGFGFACVPQQGGGGLDAVPEVIMNLPKYRRFQNHESIVLSFVTDVTNGQNLSGIRWVELRKTPGNEWDLYQEGTYSPDGFDRFMPSIAIDKKGNIGLAYNISSPNSFVGIRYTGRYVNDPLGQMTVPEFNVVDGSNTINSNGRFGDYSQMSVDPVDGTTFWYTSEYASNGTRTRIVSFELSSDSFDLALTDITQPQSSSTLGANETVTVEVKNIGSEDLVDFNLAFTLDGNMIQQVTINNVLESDSTLLYSFSTTADLSAFQAYDLVAYLTHPLDAVSFNDTLAKTIIKYNALDAAIDLNPIPNSCSSTTPASVIISNLGTNNVTSGNIAISVNGSVIQTQPWTGNLTTNAFEEVAINLASLTSGINTISVEFVNVNMSSDQNITNNYSEVEMIYNNTLMAYTLSITTDQYPTETTWEIEDSNGDIIEEGGPFSSGFTTENTTFCLANNECYTFTIFDSQGDGICCGFGQGNYSMTDASGSIIFSDNGQFNFQEDNPFCTTGPGCTLAANFMVTEDEGSANGSIMATPLGGIAPYSYSIDGGSTFQAAPLFENLSLGNYEVVVADATTNCTYEETVLVSGNGTAISGVHNYAYNFIVKPNPNDGYFQMELTIQNFEENSLNFEIIDAKGAVVQKSRMGKFNETFISPVSLVNYPSGVYFIKVYGEDFMAVKKIARN